MVYPYARVMDPYAIPKRRGNPYAMPAHRGGYGTNLPLTEPRPSRKRKVDLLFPWDVRGQFDPDYLCLIFHGRRGRGKSTGATGFGRFLYDTNRRMDPEYKVYSNYRVDFADMAHPRLVDALITFPPWLKKCLILVDEIAVYFPSLRATSTSALNFSTFLQEIRKLEVDLIFTTQFPTMIIGSANIQVDLFVEPHLFNKVYEPSIRRWVANSVQLDCVDWWGQWTGRQIKHRWPPEPEDTLVSPILHNLRSIYGQFNTKEIIPAFWHPSRQDVIQREWSEEMAAEMAEEESQMLKPPAAEIVVPAQHEIRSLRDLLDSLQVPEGGFIRLSSFLQAAQRLDPQIANYGDLATCMRRLGWSCFQQGGRYGEWMGERLAEGPGQ